jgi:biotin carboxylase
MLFVIFVSPYFTTFNLRAIDTAAALSDVRLAVVSQEALEALPARARERIAAYRRVNDALSTEQLTSAAQSLATEQGPIHRLFGGTEQLQEPLAEVRERLGIEGMRAAAARNFRDKSRMKDVLRGAGLPCARHWLAGSTEAAWAFAAEVGYPLVAKPPMGAATQATYRAGSPDELQAVLATMDPRDANPVLLEEFITGDEHSFDTFSLDGRPVFHSLTRYLPQPLDVMRNPWIQWRVILPREIDDSRYDDIRQCAFRALDALGMVTGISHLEWFRCSNGSIAISEVGARPPGAQIMTLISRANDFDALGAWCRLMIYGQFDPPRRKYAAGAAYLRGQGMGHVRAVYGIDIVEREIGHLVTDWKLPAVGEARSPSYEGEGFIVVRHPETAVVEQALARIIDTVRVELG